MAQELDDGEFWLPSDFLTDEDLLMDFKPNHLRTKRSDDFSLGFGNSFWFNSDLSSPVESVNGSVETESDEDEFMSELTRKMVGSTLQDSTMSSYYAAKSRNLSRSPQSTLCGCKQGSSRGSPDSVSRVSSPPATATAKDAGWDLLSAAAGEVTRMRLFEETTPFHSTKLFAPPPKPHSTSRVYPYQINAQAQHLAYLQLQASQFQRMKEQQMMNVWSHGNTVTANRSKGLSMAAWPTLQQSQKQPEQVQQSGSGMRAVFLETGAKKARTGTGVFLPRRFATNTSTDPRKKPGCSTTLMPDRVVHALNLTLDSVDPQSHFIGSHGNSSPDYDASLKNNTDQRSYMNQRVIRPEFRLPQDWTY